MGLMCRVTPTNRWKETKSGQRWHTALSSLSPNAISHICGEKTCIAGVLHGIHHVGLSDEPWMSRMRCLGCRIIALLEKVDVNHRLGQRNRRKAWIPSDWHLRSPPRDPSTSMYVFSRAVEHASRRAKPCRSVESKDMSFMHLVLCGATKVHDFERVSGAGKWRA